MTIPTLSLTESQTLTALRTYLQGLLGTDYVVVKGQPNRVAQPAAPDHIVMTIVGRALLEVPSTEYRDGAFDDPPTPGVRMDLAPAEVRVQLDVHGPNAANVATIVQAKARSSDAWAAFDATGFDVHPLYVDDAHQLPFINGEQQVETCWHMEFHLQCNPVITTAQDFAASVVVGVISVEERFPT